MANKCFVYSPSNVFLKEQQLLNNAFEIFWKAEYLFAEKPFVPGQRPWA